MIVQSLLLVAALAHAQEVRVKPNIVDELITPRGPVRSIPPVGFGTWMLPNNGVGADAVARAIKMGYRHLDGATAYTNQDAVGKGIAKALAEDRNIRRHDLWVTSKLWATRHKDVAGGIDLNLKQLGLDYVDLMLVHFPIGNVQRQRKNSEGQTIIGANGNPEIETIAEYDFIEMWKQMERALEPDANGHRKVHHIGISNFNVTQIEDLLAKTRVKPYVHQIESHPYLQDWKFTEFHQRLGIPIVAYAPLGNTNPEYHYRNWKSGGRLMIHDPVLKKIASARGCTPAQVALAWNLERNITVIPKAENVIHQVENYEARAKCKLHRDDMAAIKALDERGRGGKRFWDMCCAMNLPCYHGLQDGPGPNEPASADYCEDAWHKTSYNRHRNDLWRTPREVCQRPLPN